MITQLTRQATYAVATNTQVESVVRALEPAEELAYRAARRYVSGRTLDEAVQTVCRLTRPDWA